MTKRFDKMVLLVILFLVLGLFMGAECPKDEEAAPTGTSSYTFEFEAGNQGWVHQTQAGYKGVTACEMTTDQAKNGTGSLELTCDLNGGNSDRVKGEALVQLDPYIGLTGKTLSCYVYCPSGIVGSGNKLTLYAKDKYYTWSSVSSVEISTPAITANGWNSISGQVTSPTGYDITQIRAIGLQIEMSTSPANTYSGSIYLDSVGWD